MFHRGIHGLQEARCKITNAIFQDLLEPIYEDHSTLKSPELD